MSSGGTEVNANLDRLTRWAEASAAAGVATEESERLAAELFDPEVEFSPPTVRELFEQGRDVRRTSRREFAECERRREVTHRRKGRYQRGIVRLRERFQERQLRERGAENRPKVVRFRNPVRFVYQFFELAMGLESRGRKAGQQFIESTGEERVIKLGLPAPDPR